MSDKLMTAMLNTLLGMGTVFLVLIFISLIISLFVYIPGLERRLRRLGNKFRRYFARRKPEQPDPERKIPQRPRLNQEDLYDQDMEGEPDEGALIAVIMAAIVASEGGAVSADQLVVRSIRRVGQRKKRSGR